LIPEQFVTIVLAYSLLLAAVGGGALSTVVSLVLRLRWSWWRLLGDMLAAILATVIIVAAVILYDSYHDTSHSVGGIFFYAGPVVPALCRFLIYVMRRVRGQPLTS
jgi:hypothetical protein